MLNKANFVEINLVIFLSQKIPVQALFYSLEGQSINLI